LSILKKIKNFLFTKKSKSQPVIQTQVMQPAAEPIDDLFEDLPVVGVSVEDTWNPYNENNREDPVSTVVVPSSILGGAINRIKSSFILRWYCEKKKIAETGITTRQRIKRYNAMYEGKADPDASQIPKERKGERLDGKREAST